MRENKSEVVIIGAGIAGLGLGLLLSQKGINVNILEAAPQCGGRTRAVQKYPINNYVGQEINPQYLDNGPHLIIGAYEKLFKILKLAEVDINKYFAKIPFEWHSQNLKIIMSDGGVIPALIKSHFKSKGLSIFMRISLVKFFAGLLGANFEKLKNLTVSQWLSSQNINKELITLFLNPLCLSALNTKPEAASAFYFAKVLQKSFFGSAKNWQTYWAKSDLSSTIINPIIKKINELQQKNVIKTNTRVTGIVNNIEQNNSFKLITNNEQEYFCNKLIIATNPENACRLLELAKINNKIVNEQINKIKQLSYNPITSVYALGQNINLDKIKNLPIIEHQIYQCFDIVWINFSKFRADNQNHLQAIFCAIYSAEKPADPEKTSAMAFNELWGKNLSLELNWKAICEKQATHSADLIKSKFESQLTNNLYLCGDYLSDELPATIETTLQSAFLINELILPIEK